MGWCRWRRALSERRGTDQFFIWSVNSRRGEEGERAAREERVKEVDEGCGDELSLMTVGVWGGGSLWILTFLMF